MAEGWLWFGVGPTENVIRDGARCFKERHQRFAAWVRVSAKTIGETSLKEIDGVKIIVDSTIPKNNWLFGPIPPRTETLTE